MTWSAIFAPQWNYAKPVSKHQSRDLLMLFSIVGKRSLALALTTPMHDGVLKSNMEDSV